MQPKYFLFFCERVTGVASIRRVGHQLKQRTNQTFLEGNSKTSMRTNKWQKDVFPRLLYTEYTNVER